MGLLASLLILDIFRLDRRTLQFSSLSKLSSLVSGFLTRLLTSLFAGVCLYTDTAEDDVVDCRDLVPKVLRTTGVFAIRDTLTVFLHRFVMHRNSFRTKDMSSLSRRLMFSSSGRSRVAVRGLSINWILLFVASLFLNFSLSLGGQVPVRDVDIVERFCDKQGI